LALPKESLSLSPSLLVSLIFASLVSSQDPIKEEEGERKRGILSFFLSTPSFGGVAEAAGSCLKLGSTAQLAAATAHY
jgi:hypothetical protein